MSNSRRVLLQAGASFIVLAFLATPLLTRAYASTQSSITFTPSADSYISSSYPSTNYGTATTLRVDGSPDVQSYLRFSVSGLNGASISQAVLKIYANSASSAGLIAKSVSDNTWGETSITYNNMPAMGGSLGSSSAVSGGTWASMDVSSYITAEGTYSFGVITPGSTAISLASRESGADAPQLILTLGGTSATPTVGPSPTSPSAATATPTLSTTATASPSGSIKHIFTIVMENHSYKQVWSTNSAPYITQLGNEYARATNYYAITHPSLPDYLDLYGGSNYGITTDCSPSSSCHVNAHNLADDLDAKGLTWKGYMESMPSSCYVTTSGNYAPKHNPFVYFDDIRTNSTRCKSHVVPFTSFSSDLASASTTPNYAFISPDQCNDMHSCSISTGDTWLKNHVPAILSSPACAVEKCLVVITWDEDDGHSGNHVLTIFAGSAAKTGGVTSSASYTHFSLLRTVENIFGVPTQTSNDADASPMTDLLK